MQWAYYQIRKIAGCACAGNAGNVFPRRRFQRKPLVSDPGMHHGTCVPHVPWCMSGSLTCGDGENVPGIPGACAPSILRIWQEAHAISLYIYRELGLLNGIMTLPCQKYAPVCILWYFTGGSPRRGDGRSCQSNLGYTVIGLWLCDSAIGAVSTGVCLLNFVFISFVDAF